MNAIKRKKTTKIPALRKIALSLVILVNLTACGNTVDAEPIEIPNEVTYEDDEPKVSDPGPMELPPTENDSEDVENPSGSDSALGDLQEEHELIGASPESSPKTPSFQEYAALAKVVLVVDKSTPQKSSTGQTLTVFKNGRHLDTYTASTGREEPVETASGVTKWTGTPKGYYRPKRMYTEYHSRAWDGAPMPNAVFFNGGIAFHGTYYLDDLGTRASGGCIRLRPDHARQIRILVQNTGRPESFWPQNVDAKSAETPGRILNRTRVRGTALKLPDIDPASGQWVNNNLIWTWDAVVVVVETEI